MLSNSLNHCGLGTSSKSMPLILRWKSCHWLELVRALKPLIRRRKRFPWRLLKLNKLGEKKSVSICSLWHHRELVKSLTTNNTQFRWIDHSHARGIFRYNNLLVLHFYWLRAIKCSTFNKNIDTILDSIMNMVHEDMYDNVRKKNTPSLWPLVTLTSQPQF